MDFKRLAKKLAQRRQELPLDPPDHYWADDDNPKCPECGSATVGHGNGRDTEFQCSTCNHVFSPEPDLPDPEGPYFDSPQVKDKEFGGMD